MGQTVGYLPEGENPHALLHDLEDLKSPNSIPSHGASALEEEQDWEMVPPDQSDEQIEESFKQFVNDLGLAYSQASTMLALPVKNKRLILSQQLRKTQSASLDCPLSSSNSAMVGSRIHSGSIPSGRVDATPEFNVQLLQSHPPTVEELRRLRVELSGQAPTWAKKFIDLGGGKALLRHLLIWQTTPQRRDFPIEKYIEEAVRCIHYLMRDQGACQILFESDGAVRAVVLCLQWQFAHDTVPALILRILCTICLLPAGHTRIMNEMTLLLQNNRKQNSGFLLLVERLFSAEIGLELKVEYLTLINTMINASEDIWTRVSIRQQFLDSGLATALRKFKSHPQGTDTYSDLDTQISVFEDEALSDDKQVGQQKRRSQLSKSGSIATAGAPPSQPSVVSSGLATLWAETTREATQRELTPLIVPIVAELLRVVQGAYAEQKLEKVFEFLRNVSLQPGTALSSAVLPRSTLERSPSSSSVSVESSSYSTNIIVSTSTPQNEGIAKSPEPEYGASQLETRVHPPPSEKSAEISTEQIDVVASVVENTPSLDEPSVLPLPPPPPAPDAPSGSGGPPPPPPGLSGRKKPTPIQHPIAVPNSSVKLRPIHWTRIAPPDVNGTVSPHVFPLLLIQIFENIGNGVTAADLKLDFSQLESLFGLQSLPNPRSSGISSATEAVVALAVKTSPVQLISQKMSQNLSIFLSKFKRLSTSEIIDALIQWDSSVLDADSVKQLLYYGNPATLKDEIAMMTDYFSSGGSEADLDTSDRFLLELSRVSDFQLRVSSFLLSLQWKSKAADLSDQLALVQRASEVLLKSPALKRLFALLLTMGNFLNGTAKGATLGFSLEALNQMRELRSTGVTKTNLLNYCLELAMDKHPDLVTLFESDLEPVLLANEVSLDHALTEASNLLKSFNYISTEVEKILKKSNTTAQIELLLSASQQERSALLDLTASTRTSYIKCCQYLGADPKKVSSETLFGAFTSLADSFVAMKSQRARELADFQRKQKRQQAAAGRDSTAAGPAGNALFESVVDNLQRHLRSGAVLRAKTAL